MNRTLARRLTTTGVIATALLVAGATVAQADPPTVLEDQDFVDVFQFPCDGATDDPRDDFVVETRITGTEKVVLHEHTPGVPQISAHVSLREVLTNLSTGRSWSTSNHFTEKDVRVLSVEGDVATLAFHAAFHFTLFDEDGRRVAKNNGLFRDVVEVKLGTEDGVGLAPRVVGHIGSEATACEDALRFTVG